VAEFYSSRQRKKRARQKRFGIVLAVAICLLAVCLLALSKRGPSRLTPLPNLAQRAVEARDAAQYDRALQLVKDGLNHPSVAPAIQLLSDELQQDLKPDIRPYYLRKRALPARSPGLESRPRLTPDDKFYFKVNLIGALHPCYVYVFLVDSAGDWTVLFPDKAYAPNHNPLSPASYQLPDNIGKELRPPDTPGEEKAFFVVAYWRISALEELAAALATETSSARARALGQQVLKRLQLEFAKPAGIHGLKVGTWESANTGRPSIQEAEKH